MESTHPALDNRRAGATVVTLTMLPALTAAVLEYLQKRHRPDAP